jgi:hypothetical protein
VVEAEGLAGLGRKPMGAGGKTPGRESGGGVLLVGGEIVVKRSLWGRWRRAREVDGPSGHVEC